MSDKIQSAINRECTVQEADLINRMLEIVEKNPKPQQQRDLITKIIEESV